MFLVASVLNTDELECLANWDGVRSLIPIQGSNKTLFDGRALQQDKIFHPSDKAAPEDIETLLHPEPVMLLLHVDYAASLRSAGCLSKFKQNAGIDDLPLEDVYKQVVTIARDARCQAERHLQEERAGWDQLTQLVQREQQARVEAEAHSDRLRERVHREHAPSWQKCFRTTMLTSL